MRKKKKKKRKRNNTEVIDEVPVKRASKGVTRFKKGEIIPQNKRIPARIHRLKFNRRKREEEKRAKREEKKRAKRNKSVDGSGEVNDDVEGESDDVDTGNGAGEDTNVHVDDAADERTNDGSSERSVDDGEGNHEGPANFDVDGTYDTNEGVSNDDVVDGGIADSNDVDGINIENVGGSAVMDGATSGTPATEERTSNTSINSRLHVATKQSPQTVAYGKERPTGKTLAYMKRIQELHKAEKKKMDEKKRRKKLAQTNSGPPKEVIDLTDNISVVNIKTVTHWKFEDEKERKELKNKLDNFDEEKKIPLFSIATLSSKDYMQ